MKENYFFSIFIILLIYNTSLVIGSCKRSATTAGGSSVQQNGFCSGSKIFEDNFDTLNSNKWTHESTLSGGGNWEFQWYTNNRDNSYVQDGKLYILPTFTSDIYGESFLSRGKINLNKKPERCTDSRHFGCKRQGTIEHIVNPIRSAKITTNSSFYFKYGRIEVKAKMPSGDWLWPAIWLHPKHNVYGSWPVSGEIDIVESRGNKNLRLNGVNIGTEQVSATLHFGPDKHNDAFEKAHFPKKGSGFDKNFHVYEMEWSPHFIKFKVDGDVIGTVHSGDGFWKKGRFPGHTTNPWAHKSSMAPFDQEFFIIINLAVGGVNSYFPDNAHNSNGKPWPNHSDHAANDFWNGRASWQSTWKLSKNNPKSALVVDYVRVYAI